ncbi:tautomerase family protein [bacterium]|nr:tautomerase family protein [bacterium]
MPTIRIDGPPVTDLDVKRQLVKELSEAAAKAYGLPINIITVLIRENKQENVGTGGQLLLDKLKE